MSIRKSRVVIAGLVASVCALGIILAQDSQGTISTEVRINAQMLQDGRVEFALQQREGDGWGARKLVVGRYLNTRTVARDTWVASSPYAIEVAMPDEGEMSPVEPAGVQAGPPDWSPHHTTTGSLTGHWSSVSEEGNDWQIWQMYRADGPDAYVACRSGSGALGSKTEGGEWATTTARGLVDLFSFAEWHWAASAIGDIGRNCGVSVGTIVSSLIPSATTEPQPQPQVTVQEPEPRREVPVVSGTAIMTGLTHQHELAVRYDSYSRARWSVSVRSRQSIGRHLLRAGTVSVTAGGRVFSFQIEQHQHGPNTAGSLGGPGTEATLSGIPAHDFYCAAKGQTVSVSLPTTHDGTHRVNVRVREIQIRGATDLCE